jgi:hypothetical protein
MGNKDENDELELSEEELLEEQQDMAARVIQQAFRKHEAKKTLRMMIKQNFVKLKDRDNNRYIYKNKTTGEVSANKPLILGESDLKTPRSFTAPDDYRPGFEDVEGYALLVTCTKFSSTRIEDMSKHCDADHGLLEHYLSHEYICKLPAENVIPLLNPTMHMFKDALDRLRRMCKKRSYLFIYLSTHILTIHSKEKEFKGEDCFICFKDTVWKNSTLAAQTSMPWSAFAASLNSILAEEKVVTVNFCHNKAPQKSIFKSRYLYPPPDCLTRLADMANCAVIGSCNFGSQISSMQAHMPPSPTDVIEEMVKDQTDDDASQVSMDSVQKVESSVASSKRRAKDSAISPMDDILPNNKGDQTTLYNTDIVKNYQKEWLRDLNLKSVTKPVKPTKPGLRWKKVPTEAELAAAAALEAKGNTEDDQVEEKQNDDDSSVASGKRDVFAKKRVKKAAKVRVVDEVEEEELKKKTREKTQDELDLEAGLALGVQMSLPTKYDVSNQIDE